MTFAPERMVPLTDIPIDNGWVSERFRLSKYILRQCRRRTLGDHGEKPQWAFRC